MATSFFCITYHHFEEITVLGVTRRANHSLIEMISLTLGARISDEHGRVDVERYGSAKLDWLRTVFPVKNGISSHDTLRLSFGSLNTNEFYTATQT